MREHLADRYELTSLTLTPQEFPSHVADIADLDAILPAFENVDAVVHLAAVADLEAPWDDVLRNNIVGTYNVFEAARQAGVSRVVFASSHHVVGMYELDGAPTIYDPDDERRYDHTAEIRPDSLYGVSKAYGEALGRMYVERHGLRVFCLRIAAVRAEDAAATPTANPLIELDAEGRRNRLRCRLAEPARLHRADRTVPRRRGRVLGRRLRRLGEPAPVLGSEPRPGAARLGAAGPAAGVTSAPSVTPRVVRAARHTPASRGRAPGRPPSRRRRARRCRRGRGRRSGSRPGGRPLRPRRPSRRSGAAPPR